MLVSKTPLRVSFVGGGTDFPWFFEEHGGAVVSAAVNQHIFISALDSFDGKTTYLKYSQLETVRDLSDISHPIFKAVIGRYQNPPQDISVMAEIPAGNGLASSSAFTVGLVNLMAHRSGVHLSPDELARLAIELEVDDLGEPIGVQDQLGSSFPGVNFHTFSPGRVIDSTPLIGSTENFPFEMALIKVGVQSRSASKFTELQRKFVEIDREALNRLLELRDLSLEAGEVLKNDLSKLPHYVKEGWKLKVASNPNAIDTEVAEVGSLVERSGALAWKLVGAGGGGFILTIWEPGTRQTFLASMARSSRRAVKLELDFEGSQVFEL
jgi:D-glycero-alpha-D-manno-heptose-7-phosphate kinase